jgi:hypothetical protein
VADVALDHYLRKQESLRIILLESYRGYVFGEKKKGTYQIMPQKEDSDAIHQQADSDYGRYEGNQKSFSRQQYETSSEQDVGEIPSGKVYPRTRDNTNILSFALVVIALVLLVLFGYLFVVVVGGMAGAISFAAACFVLYMPGCSMG